LADPTRRALLDLLRTRPRTTGDLVQQFQMSRFGIMKHLQRLVEAGLVIVRRDGRRRWNHINPVPIQEIHRRWIRPFETGPADALLRIRARAEQIPPTPAREGDEMLTQSLIQNTVQLEIEIDRTPEEVWALFFDDTMSWWPDGFFCYPKKASAMRIDERLGGLMVEEWGADQGMVWSTITALERHREVAMAGDIVPQWGGPARSVSSYRFEPREGGTTLSFQETIWGAPDEGALKQIEGGWKMLLVDGLKKTAEQ
jgi:DNA-binding transcriptional ArsR family regulator/uncharacterized protein YndB with AHSA1/START domain